MTFLKSKEIIKKFLEMILSKFRLEASSKSAWKNLVGKDGVTLGFLHMEKVLHTKIFINYLI